MTDDPQSRIFREASEDEHTPHELLEHPDGTLDDLEPEPGKTVEDYEAEGWDVDKSAPKSLAEAQENLAARIADPGAPDTEAEAGAYDRDNDDGLGDVFADESHEWREVGYSDNGTATIVDRDGNERIVNLDDERDEDGA